MTDQKYILPVSMPTGSADQLICNNSGQLSWAAPGSVSNAWLLTGNAGTNPAADYLGTQDNKDLVLRTNATERMRVLAGGNVGIGTTAPVATLQVQAMNGTNQLGRYTVAGKSGSLSIIDTQSGASTTPFAPAIMGYGFSEDHRALRISGRIDTGADAGTVPVMTFDSRVDGSEVTNRPLFEWSNYLSQRMTMLANGNLGIGTATPEAVLHLKTPTGTNTTLRMDRNASGYDAALRFFSGSTERGHVMSDNQNTLWLRNTNSNSDVRLGVNVGGTATTAVTVRGNSGNVGIGTTTPAGRLHVAGKVFVNTLPAADETPVGWIATGPTNQFQLVDNSGSSIHFKENVDDLEFDFEAFLSLQPRRYNWKPALGGKQSVGFIAQEAGQVFPELADIRPKHSINDDGTLNYDSLGRAIVDTTQLEPYGFKYHKLPIYLFSIVKRLYSENTENQQRIDALERQLAICCASPQLRQGQTGQLEFNKPENKRSGTVALISSPNPFNDFSDISTTIPVHAQNASVIIVDGQGKVVQHAMLSAGQTASVRVYASEIGIGLFTCYLLVNGEITASCRIVSTK